MRLQTLDADLCRFHAAVDGPPGAVAELADEICDRDWYVDGVDIRDFMPERGSISNAPTDGTMNAAASSATDGTTPAPNTTAQSA
jgi:hypothetical protein